MANQIAALCARQNDNGTYCTNEAVHAYDDKFVSPCERHMSRDDKMTWQYLIAAKRFEATTSRQLADLLTDIQAMHAFIESLPLQEVSA